MSRPVPRKSSSVEPSNALVVKAEEALRDGKFKDAIELFKPLIKQDPRPEWRSSLGDAYLGRAKGLAAKGMVKEALGVLDNAVAMHGTCKDPVFLVRCLIRLGQFDKALKQAAGLIGAGSASAGDEAALSDLTAALYMAFPTDLGSPADDQSARAKWIGAAKAAREALNAWIEGRTEDEIDPLLARISLRSPFKAVRLIVKSLLCLPYDQAKARQLLDGVEPRSPFAALKAAVLAALSVQPEEAVRALSLATAPQRAFTVEITGGDRDSSRFFARLIEAERTGPAALFAFLLKHVARLPNAETRAACFNLLPRLPEQIGPFERTFGPLPPVEKERILALAAEAAGHWHRAEKHWRSAAALFESLESREAKLSAGALYRHLAGLAEQHPEFEGAGDGSEPAVFYLKRSMAADPEHLPTLLRLIDTHAQTDDDDKNNNKEWHALAEEAVRRFPQESAVLLRAVDSAVARKAYKKAAGFAQKLLVLDPINKPARQRMIDLQIAQARKQIRAKRPDLAWKELTAAEQWEAVGSPNATLRINQGLVGLILDQGASAEARLREGAALAGGPVGGWLRVALQEALMMPPRHAHGPIIRTELERMLEQAPDKAQIDAVVAAFNSADVKADPKTTHNLCWRMCRWLAKAAHLPVPLVEFHALADVILRAQTYDVLGAFARASQQREPDEPAWRFYQIVARTKNDPEAMTMTEGDALEEMLQRASGPQDFHWFNRIQRYFDSSGDDPAAKRRARRRSSESHDGLEEAVVMGALAEILSDISPDDIKRTCKRHGQDRACAMLRDRLADTPLGTMLPPALLNQFVKHMVITALDA